MVIPTGYGQVNLIFAGSDLPYGAQMTFGVSVTALEAGPDTAADVVDSKFVSANIASVYDNDIRLAGILVKYGPNDTGPAFLKTVSHNGTSGSGGSVPSVSALIRKQTAAGGHAGRGRMYQPGMIAGNYDNTGHFTGTHASAITSVWEAFRTGMETALLPLVLLHGEGSPITTPSPIIGLSCDGVLATQRRRLRR